MTLDLFGVDLFGEPVKPRPKSVTAERFIVPPFSVLNARDGEWQDRKRAWVSLGIQSETGRSAELIFGGTSGARSIDFYKKGKVANRSDGSSIFDPVLCEVAYSWHTSAGDTILDPFAGGSVRGIVASMMGRKYYGIDIRAEQVEANRTQAEAICDGAIPTWVCGDSRTEAHGAPDCDFVFSCPPYGDLEVYSDDPLDLSTMKWGDFAEAYRDIIFASVSRLRADRFACFVVGDVRDERGAFRGLPLLTVEAFRAAGADLYNEAVLVTPVATAAMRCRIQFESSRKMPRTHQSVLVFVKGDPRAATVRLAP